MRSRWFCCHHFLCFWGQLNPDVFQVRYGTQAGASGDKQPWNEVVHGGRHTWELYSSHTSPTVAESNKLTPTFAVSDNLRPPLVYGGPRKVASVLEEPPITWLEKLLVTLPSWAGLTMLIAFMLNANDLQMQGRQGSGMRRKDIWRLLKILGRCLKSKWVGD